MSNDIFMFFFFFSFLVILYNQKPFWSELSYYMYFIMFNILSFVPVGVGFKMVGYNIGLDNISLSLNILSLWVSILMVYSSTLIFMNKNSDIFFMLVLLILLMTLLVSFFSMHFFMFYFFFEFSLIPTLILIMGWGYQPERIQAGIYFLFYTLMAFLPLLLSLFYVYLNLGSLFIFMFDSMHLKSSLSIFFLFL